mmetsp:Transcript_4097/g.6273  ORF Transcript_4097/g.6273 Transcript_4097/m.6273 type:complete len:234 (+) Transcript_4097:50-751(+)
MFFLFARRHVCRMHLQLLQRRCNIHFQQISTRRRSRNQLLGTPLLFLPTLQHHGRLWTTLHHTPIGFCRYNIHLLPTPLLLLLHNFPHTMKPPKTSPTSPATLQLLHHQHAPSSTLHIIQTPCQHNDTLPSNPPQAHFPIHPLLTLLLPSMPLFQQRHPPLLPLVMHHTPITQFKQHTPSIHFQPCKANHTLQLPPLTPTTPRASLLHPSNINTVPRQCNIQMVVRIHQIFHL